MEEQGQEQKQLYQASTLHFAEVSEEGEMKAPWLCQDAMGVRKRQEGRPRGDWKMEGVR
jgi:hypothetical protein